MSLLQIGYQACVQLTCRVDFATLVEDDVPGVIEFLKVSNDLRDRLGLKALPHSSTLKKFALDAEEAAIDSATMETSFASHHFQSRNGRTDPIRKAVDVLTKAAISSQRRMVFDDAGYDAGWSA